MYSTETNNCRFITTAITTTSTSCPLYLATTDFHKVPLLVKMTTVLSTGPMSNVHQRLNQLIKVDQHIYTKLRQNLATEKCCDPQNTIISQTHTDKDYSFTAVCTKKQTTHSTTQ